MFNVTFCRETNKTHLQNDIHYIFQLLRVKQDFLIQKKFIENTGYMTGNVKSL